MGALIVQYALTEMEQNNEDHYTDLYISFDGPHTGANAPIGIQKALLYFSTADGFMEGSANSAADIGMYALNTPSAKQMLIHHYLYETSGVPQGAPNFRNRFQNTLNSIGFPQQCRNIALINGSVLGNNTAEVSGNMLNVEIGAILGGFLQRKVWINFTSNSGNKNVFRYLKKNWWGLYTQADIKKYSSTLSNYGSLDNAPGGYLDIKGKAEKAIGGHFPYYFVNGFTNTDIYSKKVKWYKRLGISIASVIVGNIYAFIDLTDNAVFVPTKSALAFTGSNKRWDEQIGCRNLVCTGETPFDSYYAPAENQEHASMHTEGVNWMIEELSGNIHTEPKLYNNCSNNSITISGNSQLCRNQSSNYSIGQCNTININWSVSNGLQILSSNNQQITVRNLGTGSSLWVKATTQNGQSFTKKIIGKPTINYQIEQNSQSPKITLYGLGININQQGIYATNWSQTGGNGQLISSSNSYTATATGYGSNWLVTGNVTVTNSCGSITKSFTVTPTITDPCNYLEVLKISSNKYKIIDPCNEEIQMVNNSQLFNIYGVKVKDISPNQNKLNVSNPNSSSGTVRILKATLNGKSISKTIIMD